MGELDSKDLARRVVCEAIRRGLTVSTAESITAGLVSSSIADVPGASSVLRGGAATYCDGVKHDVLGVSSLDLELHSAVSEPVARQMAEGSLTLFSSDLAVSLTGYAGPGGGANSDPVGTVYIGLASRSDTICRRCSFAGDRSQVRNQACAFALKLLLEAILHS